MENTIDKIRTWKTKAELYDRQKLILNDEVVTKIQKIIDLLREILDDHQTSIEAFDDEYNYSEIKRQKLELLKEQENFVEELIGQQPIEEEPETTESNFVKDYGSCDDYYKQVVEFLEQNEGTYRWPNIRRNLDIPQGSATRVMNMLKKNDDLEIDMPYRTYLLSFKAKARTEPKEQNNNVGKSDYTKFMAERMKELYREGYGNKEAMKKAAKEWRQQNSDDEDNETQKSRKNFMTYLTGK